ncbi:hypothetical protein AHF37_12495 [Paragonimus kellicotti]|nr:hypothetical protein AHF37_12495 [Paragonimus kellicotti]
MNRKAHKMYGVVDPIIGSEHSPGSASLTTATSSTNPCASTSHTVTVSSTARCPLPVPVSTISSRTSTKSHSPPNSGSTPQTRPRLNHQTSMPTYPSSSGAGNASGTMNFPQDVSPSPIGSDPPPAVLLINTAVNNSTPPIHQTSKWNSETVNTTQTTDGNCPLESNRPLVNE